MIKKEPVVFIIVIFFFSLFSCKTGKSVIRTNTPEKLSDSLLLQKMSESNLQFDFLEFDCEIDFNNDGTIISGNADVRMKKNEYIWIAVKKFGFEIARLMIQPDSFFVLDRFNRNYSAESNDYLKKNFGLPFEFAELQDLMTGNNLLSNQTLKSRIFSDNNYKIETAGSKYNVSYIINTGFYTIFARIFDNIDKSMEVSYSDFKKYKKTEIPHSRNYIFKDNSHVNYIIDIHIKDFIIDKPHKIKFEIPSGYEKI